jgi:hypothetical protein
MKLARTLTVMVLAAFAGAAADPYAPLRLYAGSWRVTRSDMASGAKPDDLTNQCTVVGKYFVCQQTVNGAVTSLMIFAPADQPGHYYTQNVNTEGRALGRGDLEISGDRWSFSNAWDQGSKMTFYRTVNTFTGRDHIHFEQQESANRRDWVTKSSGDETRVGR